MTDEIKWTEDALVMVDDNTEITETMESDDDDDGVSDTDTDLSMTSLLDEFDALHMEMNQTCDLYAELDERMGRLQERIRAEEASVVEEEKEKEEKQDPLLEWMETTHRECMEQLHTLGVVDFLHRVLDHLEKIDDRCDDDADH